MTTTEPHKTVRLPGARLKHFCMVISTIAGVATLVITWLAYLHMVTH